MTGPDYRTGTIVVTGVATTVLLAAILSHGIYLSPDGWAYWQAAVSFVGGHGYVYFYHHLTINDWPPGFPLYIALWDSIAGVSGRTLAWCTDLLGGISASAWSWCIFSLFFPESQKKTLPWQAAISTSIVTALLIVENYQDFRAENLAYALLPLLIVFTCRAAMSLDSFLLSKNIVLCATIGALLMIVRNADISFVAAAATVTLASSQPMKIKVLRAAFILILSCVPALLVSRALGQQNTHPVHLGAGHFSTFEDFRQMVSGFGYVVSHSRKWVGLTVFAVWFAGALVLSLTGKKETRDRLVLFNFLGFCGLSLFFELILFNVTAVGDPLSGRFVTFAPLMVIPATIAHAVKRMPPAILLLLSLILSFQTVLDLSTAARHGTDPQLQLGSLVLSDDTIQYPIVCEKPIVVGNKVIVSPPIYRWILKQARNERRKARSK